MLPNPPAPLFVLSSSFTIFIFAVSILLNTICAIFCPFSIINVFLLRLITITPTSPLYPESIVPGVFTMLSPCFMARPDFGLICPSYPFGIAICIPVGTTVLCMLGSIIVSAAYMSIPASPGCA